MKILVFINCYYQEKMYATKNNVQIVVQELRNSLKLLELIY